MKNPYFSLIEDLLDEDTIVGNETFNIDDIRFEDGELYQALKSEKEQSWRDQ